MPATNNRRAKSTAAAAAQIYNFLRSLPAITADNRRQVMEDLESCIATVNRTMDSHALQAILADFGFNSNINKFTIADVDLKGLRIALSRKSLMLSSRASQLGPDLSSKSFAPAMLLSHLLFALNQASHSPSSSFSTHSTQISNELAPSLAVSSVVRQDTTDITLSAKDSSPPSSSANSKNDDTELLHLAMSKPTQLSPASFFFSGVCLLVDISGFTRLSGAFCALGKEGIDGLQKATNGYMGRLVEVIYKYGGDIIKFAGDAIICVFADRKVRESISMGRGEGIRRSASRRGDSNCGSGENEEGGSGRQSCYPGICKLAMTCAMELRDICTEELTVHVAVSCGEMCFGVLGGVNDKWECLISGHCLMELSQCLDDAPSKQVAVTGAVASMVGEEGIRQFGGEQLESGNFRLTCKPDESALGAGEDEDAVVDWVIQSSRPEYMKLVNMFVPMPVILAFESGGLKYLAEIREVTVMFMKWDSYSPEAHGDLVTLQEPFCACQSLIGEMGGFIRQFLVDDKGCVLIACWGVPTASFLNNAHRALSTAARIRGKFAEMDLQCSIGITTGNVFCGNVGSEIRREYAAVGDIVNLSARLMSKAHGGVFVDEATYSRLSINAMRVFDELEPLCVKGKADPVPAFSLQSGASIPVLTEPTIEEYEIKVSCRTALLRLLDQMLPSQRLMGKSRLQTSLPSQLVILEGRLGSGKGTTVKWLCREAGARSIKVVRLAGLDANDVHLEFRAIYGLFIEFVGRETYNNPLALNRLIFEILKEIYGSNLKTIVDIALPAIRAAFDLNIELPSDAAEHFPPQTMYSATSPPSPMSKRKLPVRMIVDTVRDLFQFLIGRSPTVVILEDVHFCDECSLKCLLSLRDAPIASLMVFTLLSSDETTSLNAATVRKHLGSSAVSRQGLLTFETAATGELRRNAVERMEHFRVVMSQHPHATFIHMGDFNISEIDAMIRAALNLSAVPLGLAQWVQQLSGGSIYWINEMLEFLKATGVEEFVRITKPIAPGSQDSISGAVPPTAEKALPLGGKIGFNTVKIATPSPTTRTVSRLSTPVESLTPTLSVSVSMIESSNDAKRSQLELFILCRFEKLPLDDQRILKCASVIGFDFSRYVLYGILGSTLKSHLHAALKNLIKEKWIVKSVDSSLPAGGQLPLSSGGSSALFRGSDSEYMFCHPLAWETLYGLIPPGDRTNLHRSVAEYYENMTDDEPSLFERISSHFSHCDTVKAFEYAMRAAVYHLQENIDLTRSLSLMVGGQQYCSSVVDVDVLLTLLGTAQLIFYSDLDNISIKRVDGSTVRLSAPVVRPRGCWRFFLCCSKDNNAVKLFSNSVRPLPRPQNSSAASMLRSQRLTPSASSVSLADAGRNYSEQGRKYIVQVSEFLDEQLGKLRQHFEQQGKLGVTRRWHRDILEGGNASHSDDYSWKAESIVSKPSLTTTRNVARN